VGKRLPARLLRGQPPSPAGESLEGEAFGEGHRGALQGDRPAEGGGGFLKLPDYPHSLRGLEVKRPNQAWCIDISYLRIRVDFAMSAPS